MPLLAPPVTDRYNGNWCTWKIYRARKRDIDRKLCIQRVIERETEERRKQRERHTQTETERVEAKERGV